MPIPNNHQSARSEMLIQQLRQRAQNLYQTRQLLCAEAVLVTLNQGLRGNLGEAQAIAMAAPFSNAMGDSGCLCGALSGAVMACGLFLEKGRAYRNRKAMRDRALKLHDRFKADYGSTCCRILTRGVIQDKKAHFDHCAQLTGKVTALAAQLILKERPELIRQADPLYLEIRQTSIKGTLRWVLNYLLH